jgi:hypothetical protein
MAGFEARFKSRNVSVRDTLTGTRKSLPHYMEALRAAPTESTLVDFHEMRQDLREAPCKGTPPM